MLNTQGQAMVGYIGLFFFLRNHGHTIKKGWFHPFRARRKMWGYCAGDRYPCYVWERRSFDTYEAARAWVLAQEPKPPIRLTIAEELLVQIIEQRRQDSKTDTPIQRVTLEAHDIYSQSLY